MKPFYANGKLMLTSEYLVLHGASALCLPLQLGQSLFLLPGQEQSALSWKAYYNDKVWFSAKYNTSNLKVIDTTDKEKANALAGVLKTIIELSSSFQRELFNWDVETHLEFHPDWGLGSSSTLTALLAEWAELNPIDLHFQTSDGSGCDVACAIAQGPIIYKIKHDSPQYRHVHFVPQFADNIFFAWLGKKQSSAESIQRYKSILKPAYEEILFFNNITEDFLHAENWMEFGKLMTAHEERMAAILGTPSIASKRFDDLDGYVKSLGAWGGDFIMIATGLEKDEIISYLRRKKIDIVFSYKEIVQHGDVI